MLTACGIETFYFVNMVNCLSKVATVLTACGIETNKIMCKKCGGIGKLQQCLPLAVLKLRYIILYIQKILLSCNSAYRLRY